MTRAWRLAVVWMMASAAIAAAQQGRDTAPLATGTASISGTVLLAGSGKQAARRVRVTLTNLARTSPGLTTTTDDRGAFVFTGLPTGRFEVQAHKAAYLRSSYGASRPERPGTPVVVKDGDVITNLAITIAKGGAITGTVRDARNRPVPGITVRALKFGFNGVTGERTLGMQSLASQVVTDDRGEYRTYGLPPGNYLVLVPAPDTGGGGSGPNDFRQLSVQDVQQAMAAAKSGATLAAAGPAAAPAPRVNHAAVFHPGSADIGAAAVITLGLSEERRGVDITMQLVPTSNVTGTITSPTGTLPAMLAVRLTPAGPNTDLLAGAGLRGPTGQLRPDGTFSFSGVAPGAYTLKALMGTGRATAVPQPETPNMWAMENVTVVGRDLNVPLTLQPGMPINGRVIFEGAQPTPAELQALTFRLLPFGTSGEMLSAAGRVDAEGRFSFTSVPPDSFRILTMWTAPNASNRWTIKSAVASGREAWDAPLRVEPGQPVDLTVTYTDKPTALAGVFQDGSGRAATDYFILLFPVDRAHWIPGSRRIRSTRPGTDGAFNIRGIAPGEYYLAALTDLDANEANDPLLLSELIKTAARVTLRDGETTTQDFRIK